MYEQEILMLALVVIGLVILVAGFKKIKGMKKINPFLAVAGAVLFFIAGAWAGGYIDFEWGEAPTATAATICADFDVTPSVGASEASLNSDEDTFTVGAIANTSTYAITEIDNTTWVDPQLDFICKPNPPAGATQDDLATIFYEVVNPDIDTTDGTDTYKLFTKSGGNRQCVWTGDGTDYVDGQSTMLMTENLTLTLTLDVDQDSFARMENTFDPITVRVRFYNNCGWSETYDIDFMLIEQWS